MPRASGSMAWASFSYIITPLVAMGLLYVAAKILTYVFPKVYWLLGVEAGIPESEYSRHRKPWFRNFGNRHSGGGKLFDWLVYHLSGSAVLSSPEPLCGAVAGFTMPQYLIGFHQSIIDSVVSFWPDSTDTHAGIFKICSSLISLLFYRASCSSQEDSVTREANLPEICGQYRPNASGFRWAGTQNNHTVLGCWLSLFLQYCI